ncbi:MAG: IS21 family transposase [Actinomycetota bacterium]|nr:IS21 family transposase [Actinomycetota bacterium]
MPAKRLSMRKIKDLLRLRWGDKLSRRDVGRSVGSSPSTVSDCEGRAQVAGLGWPLPEDLDDAALEALLYPPPQPSAQARMEPDWNYIHKELRRKHVTRMLLWQEYKADHPDDGYQYSQFCDRYRAFKAKLDVVMRQDHRAGEKAFVDFSGDGIAIVDPDTGEVGQAELFVAVLGASCFTYAEAFESQELRCWIEGHIHAYEHFEGVPTITVPDQPRTSVSKPCRYDPELNRTYQDMAEHYKTAVIPARPRKPRDKAKVENGVLIAQRWILAALRNHTFFSIEQANDAIWEKLDELNGRKFQKLDTTRRELFETLDRPALKPLPSTRYVYADWFEPKVSLDYHVEIDEHYYSVPYTLVHQKVDVRVTATTVEVLFKNKRIASHARSYAPNKHTTLKEHMPLSHQRHAEWTPSRILNWAHKTGPATAKLAEEIMAGRPHPEQGYRACLGVIRLGKSFGEDRLEAACERALKVGACSYRSVQSILKTGLDRQQLLPEPPSKAPTEHENVRGPDYYK